MYRIVHGNSQGLADVAEFINLINSPPVELRGFFDRNADIFVARAPGRLDVMGGIADYSGSLVLEMPIAEATFAAVQKTDESAVKILSVSGNSGKAFVFEMKLAELKSIGKTPHYKSVKEYFSLNRSHHWASYVAGAFFVLQRELGVDFKNGARILISSKIPIGKGVSSSAALEVATMQAVCAAFDIRIEPRELALLCQKVENTIVGAACGVMDQITAHCGVENALISLLCQPAEIQGTVKIPDAIEFWGIDSGVRHAVAGSDYTSVRIGAFMSYRIIADLAGLQIQQLKDGVVKINDPRWHGYLSNVSPAEYQENFASRLPEAISGDDFIEKYGGTTDAVTRIDPAKTYAIKAPSGHAIYENHRVRAFSELLQDAINDEQLDALGELMFQSHASYAACGLTEAGTDRIVELVRDSHDGGLFGARITGGGSGGTVAILSRSGNRSAILDVAGQYERDTGKKPYIFHGSSPGCSTFGHLRLSSASVEPAASG
jgi:L-arabinokinase